MVPVFPPAPPNTDALLLGRLPPPNTEALSEELPPPNTDLLGNEALPPNTDFSPVAVPPKTEPAFPLVPPPKTDVTPAWPPNVDDAFCPPVTEEFDEKTDEDGDFLWSFCLRIFSCPNWPFASLDD